MNNAGYNMILAMFFIFTVSAAAFGILDSKNLEVSASTYVTVADMAKESPGVNKKLKVFLEDDILTRREYFDLYEIYNAEKLEVVKEKVLTEFK